MLRVFSDVVTQILTPPSLQAAIFLSIIGLLWGAPLYLTPKIILPSEVQTSELHEPSSLSDHSAHLCTIFFPPSLISLIPTGPNLSPTLSQSAGGVGVGTTAGLPRTSKSTPFCLHVKFLISSEEREQCVCASSQKNLSDDYHKLQEWQNEHTRLCIHFREFQVLSGLFALN